jgi:5-methylthioribose kinase
MTKEELSRQYPEVTLLDREQPEEVMRYARARGLVEADEPLLAIEKPGEGNMNYTLRLTTASRSIILKQSRPWVEKYPQIAAPWDRVIREARFYQLVSQTTALAGAMPEALDLDPISRVLATTDLGAATDFTDLYENAALETGEFHALGGWLSALHRAKFSASDRSSLINRDMRTLNHEHIYHFPLVPDNGLDLDAITPGLGELAKALINDTTYVQTVTALGKRYLEDGTVLLHGDFFPGSWLHAYGGVRIIDPEFAFFGLAEFDAGVFMAHLYLTGGSDAEVSALLEGYQPPAGFDPRLMRQMAGVEIMRRLIGVAQLPLASDLDAKRALLELSRRLVLEY